MKDSEFITLADYIDQCHVFNIHYTKPRLISMSETHVPFTHEVKNYVVLYIPMQDYICIYIPAILILYSSFSTISLYFELYNYYYSIVFCGICILY